MSCRLPLTLVLLLAGCADAGNYPSLLPRAGEAQGFAEPAPAAPQAVVADPALDARIAAIRATLDAPGADAAFARADRLGAAARGAAAGSEAWLDAQVALAELDTLRSDAVAALTDLEQLATERALALAPDYPALAQAIADARQAVETRQARIAAIEAMLAPA